MDYFPEIPKILYPNIETGAADQFVALTNILNRSAFLKEIMENTSLYYDYDVREGETPELIAHKLYGDPRRFWIVLMFNNLMNPHYDFPLVIEQLHGLIENKYGITVEQSQSQIHHYEERVTSTTYYNGVVQSTVENVYVISELVADPTTGIATVRPYLPGIADTSLSGPSTSESFGSGVTVTKEYTYHAISVYTHEYELNEKRRRIQLLDSDYVAVVEDELRRLMRNG